MTIRLPPEVLEEMARAIWSVTDDGGDRFEGVDKMIAFDELTAALSALEARRYVIVPREATKEMRRRGGDAAFSCYEGYNAETKAHMRMMDSSCEPKALRVWSAMLAASESESAAAEALSASEE